MKKTVLTIATGKPLYINLAVNLARSFYRWNTNAEITFCIVTDSPELLPEDVAFSAEIKTIRPGELGEGFSTKLFLDKVAPQGQTLFIDSDCLIFGDLSSLFDRFKGMQVAVVGNYISSGEWFGDINAVCKRFDVPHLPKFNGGLYYLENGDAAARVYERARLIEKQYDEIGFVRLRNRPNDEVIMALAMQLEGMKPLIDDGSIMSDPLACPGKYQIDIIKGNTLLVNPPLPHPEHRAWYPFEKVHPLIVHFLGEYTLHYPYRREVFRLEKAADDKLTQLDNLRSLIRIEYPERLKLFFKNTFRSTYHRLFGVRKIKSSDRIIT
ncbi:hypothetical protein [Mucilaginibacter xinganensis]|uniref:Glycosyl transferase family 8 n=1 Tax=Mucilaginibacter xinganensis TaxID=1234841 RepID=A0A223P3Y0_9SPHI|nr:hypothetical protein [Mucilaginibacter xinganensis]ASU36786.1 hypothetical protein MuYL_4903 [Mucilaginibacter xinganensis]